MSGGKSMKKSVIGSRRTLMNSLKRMAFRPRKEGAFIGSARELAEIQGKGNVERRTSNVECLNERHPPGGLLKFDVQRSTFDVRRFFFSK